MKRLLKHVQEISRWEMLIVFVHVRGREGVIVLVGFASTKRPKLRLHDEPNGCEGSKGCNFNVFGCLDAIVI